ncbi:uncharacterized protein KGF55_003973 [Candida pseudojiufengensis]|uniref:uncharacterized protein n=1 Tax=Candida pseudojiufengensis TaxID=497109 RepID=UPI002224BF93|nr:uncharacterized protein KGF55_003973 [Candida pseudojiufengensis]KAI5961656.1 hypothetical protein KGF55_003973 [Candida pseudojiufengensis]
MNLNFIRKSFRQFKSSIIYWIFGILIFIIILQLFYGSSISETTKHVYKIIKSPIYSNLDLNTNTNTNSQTNNNENLPIVFPNNYFKNDKQFSKFITGIDQQISELANNNQNQEVTIAKEINPIHNQKSFKYHDLKNITIFNNLKQINLNLSKCNEINQFSKFQISEAKDLNFKNSLTPIVSKILKEIEKPEGEGNLYLKQLEKMLLPEIKLQIILNVVDKFWFKLAESSTWLKQYSVHYSITRILYCPTGIRNQPIFSLTYAQIFDENWNEIDGFKIYIPMENVEDALNNIYKESKIKEDKDKTQKQNSEKLEELKSKIGKNKPKTGGNKQDLGGTKQDVGESKQDEGGTKQDLGETKQVTGENQQKQEEGESQAEQNFEQNFEQSLKQELEQEENKQEEGETKQNLDEKQGNEENKNSENNQENQMDIKEEENLGTDENNNQKENQNTNKRDKINKDKTSQPPPPSIKHKVLTFPQFISIPFFYDLNDPNGKFYGPEDPRLILVKNKLGYVEPLLIYNADHMKLTYPDEDNSDGVEPKWEHYRSMFLAWPWQINPESDKNEVRNLELKLLGYKYSKTQKNWTPFLSYLDRFKPENNGYDQHIYFIFKWGPLRGGTQLININEILNLPASYPKEIWVGIARCHLNNCGCGRTMYRPNLVIITKEIDQQTREIFYKITHVSSALTFDLYVFGWDLMYPENVCIRENILIPNGISLWSIEKFKEINFNEEEYNLLEENGIPDISNIINNIKEDYMTITLTIADYTNFRLNIKGLLKDMINWKIFEITPTTTTKNYKNNDNIVCALDSSEKYCKEYGLKNKIKSLSNFKLDFENLVIDPLKLQYFYYTNKYGLRGINNYLKNS